MTTPFQLPTLSDPLIFTAQTLVNTGAGGSVNTAALANPHGMPMELLEMRFRVFPERTATEAFTKLTGQSIGVKIDMGNIPIVDSAVPISQFGSFRDTSEFGSQQFGFNGFSAVPTMYKWRLKYPLYVPAGSVVVPSFEHLGQNPFPVNVEVIYICRTVPENQKIPARLMVPWVGSFNSKSFDQLTGTAASSDQSSELDLLNPFRVPLEIVKLTGRASLISTDNVTTFPTADEERMQFRSRLATVRIRSSRGDDVVRTPTPFNGLFPLGWRAWDIGGQWLMRPGEFYKVRIDVAAVDFATAADDNESTVEPGRVQFSVGMIGYRSIATKAIAEAV